MRRRRGTAGSTIVIALLAGAAAMAPFLVWSVEPLVPAALLAFAALVPCLLPFMARGRVRWAWLAVSLALFVAWYQADRSSRSGVTRASDERLTKALQKASDACDRDVTRAEARFDDRVDRMARYAERLIRATSSTNPEKTLSRFRQVVLRDRVLALSDGALEFLSERHTGEPPRATVAGIPAGVYAAYRKATCDRFLARYQGLILAAIDDVGRFGVPDSGLGTFVKRISDPDRAEEAARRLDRMARQLPIVPQGGSP
jgi:hypothetical protein